MKIQITLSAEQVQLLNDSLVHSHLYDRLLKKDSLAWKELLLWHQHLSYAGLTTIHNLHCGKKTPAAHFPSKLVLLCHLDLIPCKYKPPSSVIDCLLCAACEIAKAKLRQPLLRSLGGPAWWISLP